MEKKIEEWGWLVGVDRANGPYPSRDAAITAARKEHEGVKVKIEVGVLLRPDPVRYLPDMDIFLEHMDERALDEDFAWHDDTIFYVKKDRTAAEAALQTALEEWTKEWVETETIWTLTDTEIVTIGA